MIDNPRHGRHYQGALRDEIFGKKIWYDLGALFTVVLGFDFPINPLYLFLILMRFLLDSQCQFFLDILTIMANVWWYPNHSIYFFCLMLIYKGAFNDYGDTILPFLITTYLYVDIFNQREITLRDSLRKFITLHKARAVYL